MAERIEGPEQDEYTLIPRQDLDAAIARIAAPRHWHIVAEAAKYPSRTGDRSARFRALTDRGETIFMKTLGTWHETTRAFFRHEIPVLQALNANPSNGFYVPRLFEHGNESGIVWMATEWVDASEGLVLSEATFEPLVRALCSMRDLSAEIVQGHHGCPKSHHTWGADTYWANIQDPTGRLARPEVGLLSSESRDRIMRFMNRHIDSVDECDIRPVHGDFAPGNLTIHGNQVAVLDWESSHLDRGPIDVAHYVSTRDVWRTDLAARLEVELWKGPPEILTLAKIERLAGRANDTYQRRREIDANALQMLEDLAHHLPT